MTTTDRIALAAERNDAKLAELAAAMGLKTNGRAAYMKMLAAVQCGEVKPITGSPRQVTQRVIAARKRADRHSSWGWLSARAGISEGTLKKQVAAAGYPVYGERIAQIRSSKKSNKK
jgi:hypothetical protein